MKSNIQYLILAAGKDQLSLDTIPKCLSKIENTNILDKLIKIVNKNNITDINLVGGFELLKIMKQYPKLRYFYNDEWESTKSLYSFYKSLDTLNKNILISYSDILHKSETIQQIKLDKICVFYDSLWKQRYEDRNTNTVELITNNKNEILGEFSGLLYIPENKLECIKDTTEELLFKNKSSTLIDLVEQINKEEIIVIDVNGNWAELDSMQDIEHFKFGTKAETLQRLESKLNYSKVLEQYTFNVKEYLTDNNQVMKAIQEKLTSDLLVVRSSALNEDTENSSMAGNYESILKVKKNDNKILKNAIELVIESYTKNNQSQDNNNQILVQPYLENVTMSGVVFSKNLQTSSPYYTVNYDKSSDTESVTSGNSNELSTFICYNDTEFKIEDTNLSILIKAIKEIESLTKYDAIDVEFAYVEDKLYILQVRPIAAKKNSIVVSKDIVSSELNNIRDIFNSENINLLGSKKAYGVMPDWNPAEIIGINPRPLAFDLYKYIITDNIWAKSRQKLGYRDTKSAGLISFSGKPYVDIQMSFNSFIPSSLNDEISSKLINFFIAKLQKNPQYHDKVEFQIAFTAYDFNFNEKLEELKDAGFTDIECNDIKQAYKELTQNIILEKKISIKKEIDKTISLTAKREKIVTAKISKIEKIYLLLKDCKEYGTLAFSNLARFGFIGSIFLKSLLEKGILDQGEYDSFFKTIHTVAKEFMDDFSLLIDKKLTKEDFLAKYGHLRPGTYDITSLSYKDGFDNYIDFKSDIKKHEYTSFNFSNKTLISISNEIEKHNLSFNVDELISFVVKATEAREKAKFEFTKSLSLILELISDIGKEFSINTDDMSFINLYEILKYNNSTSKAYISKNLKNNIKQNKDIYLVTSAILLPELIFSPKDIDMFYYPSLKPNFATHHQLDGEIVYLKDNTQDDINSKIVLIENADPGFDWIFSHNIKGLVTKYGGAASHMAIRCAEFDLPAAIGCGDKIFNTLIGHKKISLDCINQKIKGL